ncbi:major facilitator superfamily domain-containing protein [Scleroderma yunnanense]
MSSQVSMITTHSQDAASVSGSKAADQCSVAAEGPVKPEFDPKSSADPGAFPEGGVAAWCTVIGALRFWVNIRPFIGQTKCSQTLQVILLHMGYFKVRPPHPLLSLSGLISAPDFYTRQYLTNETPSTISHYVTIGGAVLQSFSLFMLSLTKRGQFYQILLAQSIGCGIALGLMYVPSIAVLSHHFHRRRTLAMTLAASGSPIGAIIHPIMLNNLIKKIGFAHGVRISAAFVSLLLFIACLLMRTRLEPPKRPTNYLVVAKGAIRDLPFLFMTLGGFYYPVFFFQLASIKHGNSMTFSFYSLVIMNASNLIGRMSAGLITSYIGVPKSMTIATFACGVLILGMTGLGSIVSVVILGVLYGYFSGIYIALMVPLMTILTPDLSQLGKFADLPPLLGIASLFGPPASGALLTSQYKWWIPSLFSGLLVLSGNVLFVVMQLVLARRDRAIRRTSAA